MKILLLLATLALAQNLGASTPYEEWLYYKDFNESGFSEVELERVRDSLTAMDTAAYMVISDGRVVFTYGDVTRRFRSSSLRKSYLHLLMGLAYDRGDLDIDQTLQELGIDDIQELNLNEKNKTVKDLLASNSGIYHPSAHMPRSMRETMPDRHSKPTTWFYNNWDFNTLGAIYNRATQTDLFDSFSSEIADKLQLEDFDLKHTYYRYEVSKSNYPAYLFRLSTRDIARLGLLYAKKGVWHDERLVSEEWIQLGFQPRVDDLGRFSRRGKYGYLWWIQNHPDYGPIYYGSGDGGQLLFVVPDQDMVIVHMVNTYNNNRQGVGKVFDILTKTLGAKKTAPVAEPKLEEFRPMKTVLTNRIVLSPEELARYTGTYQHRALGDFNITEKGGRLYMESSIGVFELFSDKPGVFIPEEIMTPIHFQKTDDPARTRKIESQYRDDRKLNNIIFYY